VKKSDRVRGSVKGSQKNCVMSIIDEMSMEHIRILTSGGLRLSLGLLVESNALLELLIAAGRLHVLDAHMNPLLNDSTSDLLVDDNTYCALGDVPHLASAPVVESVRHTLVDSTVRNDVNVIANLVGGEVSGHGGKTILAERLLEKIASITPNTSCLTAAHPASPSEIYDQTQEYQQLQVFHRKR
jgi:hypothetical protein